MRFSPGLIAATLAAATLTSPANAETPTYRVPAGASDSCTATHRYGAQVVIPECMRPFKQMDMPPVPISFEKKVIMKFDPTTIAERSLLNDQLAEIKKDGTRCQNDGKDDAVHKCVAAMLAALNNDRNNNNKGVSDAAIRGMIDAAQTGTKKNPITLRLIRE